MKEKKKVAIIGGGASGLFCAANISQIDKSKDFSVSIFELLPSLMLKLKASGGGRCNITHNVNDVKDLAKNYPRSEKFLYSVFNRFSTNDTLKWFENYGIEFYIDQNGCVFPKSNDSKTISSLLERIVTNQNYKIILNSNIQSIARKESSFILENNNKLEKFDIIVLACGGKSSIVKSKRGINGYHLAHNLGHTIIEPKDTLTSLITSNKKLSELSGIVLDDVSIEAMFRGKRVSEIKGTLLFTHHGISGPAILNLSSLIAYIGFNNTDPLIIKLNLTSYTNCSDFEKALLNDLKTNHNKDIINIIDTYAPRNLAKYVLESLNISINKKSNVITKEERNNIAQCLTEFNIPIVKVNEVLAMASAGGVSLKEIVPQTFESKIEKNVYFCGEILDIDGFCGGYNLQFAWSSGFIVANSIVKSK